MLYTAFLNKAIKACVLIDEDTGIAYLDPFYKLSLKNEKLDKVSIISDVNVTNDDIRDALQLAVANINRKQESKKKAVVDWIYDLITTKIDPYETQENNELMKNMIEYMQAKKDNSADTISPIAGLNFSKKG